MHKHNWTYETDRWDIPSYRVCKCGAEEYRHYISSSDIHNAPWTKTRHRDDAIKERNNENIHRL